MVSKLSGVALDVIRSHDIASGDVFTALTALKNRYESQSTSARLVALRSLFNDKQRGMGVAEFLASKANLVIGVDIPWGNNMVTSGFSSGFLCYCCRFWCQLLYSNMREAQSA